MGAIYLIAIGKLKDDGLLRYLTRQLKTVFPFPCKTGGTLPHPDYAYNIKRKQYKSDLILMEIQRQDISGAEKILGVADLDIYTPRLNFVFGQATIGGKEALFALPRLRQSFYGLPEDRNAYLSRCLKEAIHELGHAFGLRHCRSPECVMHFSNSLSETDRKQSKFCDYCRERLVFP